PSGGTKSGTGSSLSWTGSTPGTYKVVATNTNGSCGQVDMNNLLTIGTKTASPLVIGGLGAMDPENLCAQEYTLSVNGLNQEWGGIDELGSNVGQGMYLVKVNLAPGESRYVWVRSDDECGDRSLVALTMTARSLPSGATITSGPNARCSGAGTTAYNGTVAHADQVHWGISPTSAGTISPSGSVTWYSCYVGAATISLRGENNCGESNLDSIEVSVMELTSYYEDKDRDGFYVGDPVIACVNPDPDSYVKGEFVESPGDCDDNDPNSGIVELWYLDADGDGFYVSYVESCGLPGFGY